MSGRPFKVAGFVWRARLSRESRSGAEFAVRCALRWGLIGGGRHSQIGESHRIAARLDGLFSLEAGALDIDPDAGRSFARSLGIDAQRAYGDWRNMLNAESAMPADKRLDLVTVATPNATHFEIARAFLEAGFHVLCEKPLTMEIDEAEELCRLSTRANKICAVNFGYAGYPMVIQAHEMIRRRDLGDIRVAVIEFAHGHHSGGDDADNPRIRWRYDPAQAGISSVTADCGIHAMHIAEFVLGQRITRISAQFDHCVSGRQLEDDALLALRFQGGAVGRVWTSAVATGQQHGLCFRIFGSDGGLRWHQERPNQLSWTPIGKSTRVLERQCSDLYQPALDAGRTAIGHSEGILEAFANMYRSLHRRIDGSAATGFHCPYPDVEDGAAMVKAVHAAVKSAASGGIWQSL